MENSLKTIYSTVFVCFVIFVVNVHSVTIGRHPNIRRRGFSFLEVVIAILLVGATIVPVFLIFSRSTAGTIQTQDEVLAHNFAEELLDFVLAQPKDSPLLVPTPGSVPVDSERMVLKTTSGDLVLPSNPKFKRLLSVREPDTPTNWPYKYKLLVAEIQWKSSSGVVRKVQMSALKLL